MDRPSDDDTQRSDAAAPGPDTARLWDPAVREAMAATLEARAQEPVPPVGDVSARRRRAERIRRATTVPPAVLPDVEVSQEHTRAADGTVVPLRVYRRQGRQPGSVMVYAHGGGLIMGSLDLADEIIKGYVAGTGVPVVAPEYRVAPEHPFPRPLQDCYAALVWAHDHHGAMGAERSRVIIGGDSAGGTLAAAMSLLARERGGPPVAAQLLVHPMLDDRTREPDPVLAEAVTWNAVDNETGWRAYLGQAYGTDDVSPLAAPGRAEDLTGMPRTLLDVGALDLFRDEVLAFAGKLWRSGVPTELHVYPGVPHGFDTLAPETPVALRALQARYDFLASV